MKKIISSFIFALFILSCKKSDPSPSKSLLIAPLNNQICLTGVVVSTSTSSVLFEWNKSENATDYDLIIKNLETGEIIIKNITATSQTVDLNRNSPYSWKVVSKIGSKTIESDEWRFYNAGEGTISYAPFPAEIVAPTFGQLVSSASTKVTLSWKGSDVDNDIIGYNIVFGTSPNSLNNLKQNVKETNLPDVDIIAETTYYWNVYTLDAKGNESQSGIYQFTTN